MQDIDKELWVAEYCLGQRCFHHDYLKKSLETNKETIERILKIQDKKEREAILVQVAWIPFAIGTAEETSQAITEMGKSIAKEKHWEDLYNPEFLKF